MEENNKFETDNTGSGSMLYSAESQPQAAESGYSAVYGAESQSQVTTPEQLTKPSESEQASQSAAPEQLTKPSEPEQALQSATPVQLTKPLEPEQAQSTMPVQLVKPSEPKSGSQDTTSVQSNEPSRFQPQGTTPVQLVKPSESAPQQVIQPWQTMPMQQGSFQQAGNGQPMNGGQPNYNGQPMNGGQPNYYGQPNQNTMGFGPMQVPPPVQGTPAPKPKKNAAGLIVGILCAAAVIIVIAIGVLVGKSLLGGGGPRQQLAKGIANMTREMAAYQSSIAEDIGLDAISELKDDDPVNTKIDFSLTDPNATGSITSVDIKVDSVTDYKKKMAEYDLSAGVYGFSMQVGSLIAADNTLYLSVPMAFESDVYSLELTNLGKNFNNSAWASLADTTLPEDYSMTLFDREKANGDEDAAESEFQKILNKQSSATADAMKFETIGQMKEFTIDGVAAEYGGVRVTMDKDVYNESMETMRDDILESDFYDEFMKGYQTTYAGDFDEFKEDMDDVIGQIFGIRFEEDIVLDFYLDKKGRIINISTPEDIALSGEDITADWLAVDISFTGTERTLDSIEGGVYVQFDDEILYMGISRNAEVTEDYYSENLTLMMQADSSDDEITFWYSNRWGYDDQTFDLKMSIDVPGSSMGISADGGYTDIVKGESYTFQLNHGALSVDGEDLLLLTGSVKIEPAENTIEVPENAINVLEMSESDIEELFYDILY